MPANDKLIGRTIVCVFIGALVLIVLWGGLYGSPYDLQLVPSPMYVFLLTRAFFLLILAFILISMAWSCLFGARQ